MANTRGETLSWKDDVMPVVIMLMITCLDMSLVTIVKAAMNGGMGSIVYIVYHELFGTLILLPLFMIHIFRNDGRPPLSFHVLCRFFVLGLVGVCLFQVLAYAGIYYSSPTMASALSNLGPANTYLLAVVFRMEKLEIRSSSCRAKLLGTVIAISGATVFTLYQGPEIFQTAGSPDLPNHLLLSQPSNWVFGGLLMAIAVFLTSIWSVLLTATAREYPDQQTIVFFYCLFGTIQCIALSPFLEPNPSAWVVQPGLGLVAIVYGAVYVTVIRNTIITWCLEKKGPVFVAMFSPLSIVIAVIMGITFLGDSLHLGSAIGATIVAAGFYTVTWGQIKEKKLLLLAPMEENLGVADETESPNAFTPLLSSINKSKCCFAMNLSIH